MNIALKSISDDDGDRLQNRLTISIGSRHKPCNFHYNMIQQNSCWLLNLNDGESTVDRRLTVCSFHILQNHSFNYTSLLLLKLLFFYFKPHSIFWFNTLCSHWFGKIWHIHSLKSHFLVSLHEFSAAIMATVDIWQLK